MEGTSASCGHSSLSRSFHFPSGSFFSQGSLQVRTVPSVWNGKLTLISACRDKRIFSTGCAGKTDLPSLRHSRFWCELQQSLTRPFMQTKMPD